MYPGPWVHFKVLLFSSPEALLVLDPKARAKG